MYKITETGKHFRRRINTRGKENVLVPPSFKPPLQIPSDISSILLVVSGLYLLFTGNPLFGWICIGLAIIIYSIRELFIQDDHTLVRIYGPFGRLRYLVEDNLRDKIRQYFQEDNLEGRPIPKLVRNYIYAKAHATKALGSFGTELDINDVENTTFGRLLHRNFPGEHKHASYNVIVGEKRNDVKPFLIPNCINVSAMSFGSINNVAAEALSFGTRDVAYCNTGEGGYGPHGASGNDVVFQIGSGKFGVGKISTLADGTSTRLLDEQLLAVLVREHPNIKMIQVKISQGAKPGHGGVLPGPKVTPEIAEVRKVTPWKTVFSPAQHAEFVASSPKESILKMIEFIQRVRKITSLPVSIKMCVGKMSEIDMLVEAMSFTKDGPDAIQIDGADGGTGAGPSLLLNYVGYGSAIETLSYLHKKLVEKKIRDRVTLHASGKIFTPAHAAVAFAYGADVIDTARAAMLALGCIQALRCHTGECPAGITTHNKWRMHGLNIPEKSTRVHNYLKGFHEDMLELTSILGHADPRDIKPSDIRLLSTGKNDFQQNFDKDPFGFYLPTPEEMMKDN